MPAGKKVLFVDDDEVIAMLAAKAVRRLGLEVESFTDSHAAIAAFAAAPSEYGVVVSDLRLGTSDAFSMCQELRRIRAGVPIVLTSGFVRPEDAERARTLGLGEVLPKQQLMARLPDLLAVLRS
jgi:CheY-like chemotaxis protein